eukprot:TRINITY_DN5947_c0_g1_i1.p1 TRINITY_DN5947_c0_g1~~TRINITY_DN5947_c0_g1_i1.p1  ORF type:complete len:815 (+),score=180.47 TRINITY_DN5947_c0_g1_i1:45-2447(+)
MRGPRLRNHTPPAGPCFGSRRMVPSGLLGGGFSGLFGRRSPSQGRLSPASNPAPPPALPPTASPPSRPVLPSEAELRALPKRRLQDLAFRFGLTEEQDDVMGVKEEYVLWLLRRGRGPDSSPVVSPAHARAQNSATLSDGAATVHTSVTQAQRSQSNDHTTAPNHSLDHKPGTHDGSEADDESLVMIGGSEPDVDPPAWAAPDPEMPTGPPTEASFATSAADCRSDAVGRDVASPSVVVRMDAQLRSPPSGSFGRPPENPRGQELAPPPPGHARVPSLEWQETGLADTDGATSPQPPDRPRRARVNAPEDAGLSPKQRKHIPRGQELRPPPVHERVASCDWRETGLYEGVPSHPASPADRGRPAALVPHARPERDQPDRREFSTPVPVAREPPPPAAPASEPAPASGSARQAPPAKPSRRDAFNWMQVLGYGASCKVILAEEKSTGVKYAVKCVSKSQAIGDEKVLQWLRNERDILKMCSHPNIVKLHEIFQTPLELFYVLEYAPGGELLEYIKKSCRFPIQVIRSITAEIVLALEYLDGKGIIHRDLKPENILLDGGMHVKIVDFGTAYLVRRGPEGPLASIPEAGERGHTSCGTWQYLSPEALSGRRSTVAVDLWALACVVYQMTTGSRPFEVRSSGLVGLFEAIRDPEQLSYPELFPEDAKSFCQEILRTDPSKRLGTPDRGGFPALKRHRLFTGIRWDSLNQQELQYDLSPAAPLFVKDADALECAGCNAEFTFFLRRHHCRKCGLIFCGRCSKHMIVMHDLFEQYGDKKVRCCDKCYRNIRKDAAARDSDSVAGL